MPSSKATTISETEVVQLWQKQMQNQRCLDDADGQPVEIIYPGRLNDKQGGDFCDAVVKSSAQCKQGNIEVHTRVSGWQAHGHHRDPVYNQVVLHVALEQDRAEKTVLQNGETIPTIILDKYLGHNHHKSRSDTHLPCFGFGRTSASCISSLDEAGDKRFISKTWRFQAELSQIEPGQCLYQGVMEALGYTKNKSPFLELARRVPLSFLEKKILRSYDSEDALAEIQALLLGKAGLLPSQRAIFPPDDQWVNRIERIWSESSQNLLLTCHDWELYKVRPGNLPVRRIAAMSYLLYRYRSQGWLQMLIHLIRTAPENRVYRGLDLAFVIVAENYWKNHYDFGPGDAAVSPVLIGRERAAEIIINVLLPFALAWSQRTNETSLARKIHAIYRSYPRLESNSIERHMRDQLALDRDQINTARRQQGLLHLYKNFCIQGKCKECDLLIV